MNEQVVNAQETAVYHIQTLLAQAQAVPPTQDVIIVEAWHKVRQGQLCRLAVIISGYGTHIEVGPLKNSGNHITWVFHEKRVTEAEALLATYLEDDS